MGGVAQRFFGSPWRRSPAPSQLQPCHRERARARRGAHQRRADKDAPRAASHTDTVIFGHSVLRTSILMVSIRCDEARVCGDESAERSRPVGRLASVDGASARIVVARSLHQRIMQATGRSDKYAPTRPSDSQIRASKREYDDGGRPTEVGALLLFPGRYGSATGYRGVKQNGTTERWSARFGDGGATNIGSYDHPIEAAVEYALHPEVVASVNSKRRGMRHPGAKPASSAKRQKTTVPLCDQDPRCELARGHDGECSFPNHESYVDSEGLEWAL